MGFELYFLKWVSTILMVTGAGAFVSSVSSVTVEPTYLYGETTYRTGGTITSGGISEEYWFPISQLEFPINNYGAALSVKKNYKDFLFMYRVARHTASYSGNLEDSDYGVTILGDIVDSDILTIHSLSPTSADSTLHHLLLRYPAHEGKNQKFFFGLEYFYQKLYFKAKDTVQTHPATPSVGTIFVDDDTITYEANYHIPMAFIQYLRTINSWEIDLKYGFSPVATSKELDDHLERNRVAVGEGDGWVESIQASVRYRFNPTMSAVFSLGYKQMEFEGRYHNYFYGSEADEDDFYIDFKSFSEQLESSVGFQYDF